jgi:hypothetical protein
VKRGYKQPVIYLLEVMHDETADQELRVTCATAAAPYVTPKFGTIVPPRFVEGEFEVPVNWSLFLHARSELELKKISVDHNPGRIAAVTGRVRFDAAA